MNINEFSELIREQFLDEDIEKLTLETKFRELKTWDSLTGMAVLTIIEETYNVAIPIDDFIKLNTISKLYNYVFSKA